MCDGDSEGVFWAVYLLSKNLSFQSIVTYKDKAILLFVCVLKLNTVLWNVFPQSLLPKIPKGEEKM